MTAQLPIVAEAERLVQRLSDALTRPRVGECLCCYVARMLAEFPCDGTHRHAMRYRHATAPRATALRSRLRSVGARCCDCEMFLNDYRPRPEVIGSPSGDDLDEELTTTGRSGIRSPPCRRACESTAASCSRAPSGCGSGGDRRKVVLAG